MEGAKGSRMVMSELESAIQTIVDSYDKYSQSKKFFFWGQKRGIAESKFREMLRSELNNMLTNTENKKAVAELIKKLDDNQDGKIDFEEYLSLIGGIVLVYSGMKEEEVKRAAAASKGNK